MANLPHPDQPSPLDRVKRFWAKAAEPEYRAYTNQANWMGHPEVQRYINRRCSGDPERTWLDHFRDRYAAGRRIPEVLNLGCGDGALERELIARGFADSYVGYDVSAECIERATATVGRDHPTARFLNADLNHVTLPREAFDVAFFSHALHHIERLEHLCEEARAALRPDGFLLVNEFIGPSRHQWTDFQLQVCNRLLDALPEHLRLDISRLPERVPRPRISRISVAEWLRCDPSEAVRSAEIVPAIERSFEILERRDFGGTVLQKLLENIAGNFLPENPDQSAIVRVLIELESVLIETGLLTSDFTYIVARPRML
jgi:SAM-dependent methyltransferase